MAELPAEHAVRRAVADTLAHLEPGSLVLVACSGGPDSVALAAATQAVHDRVGAVVVDHGLRPEARREAEVTAAWLRGQGLDPVLVRAASVVENGDGLEAAARDARYRVLHHAAVETDAALVLLGHTRDDQAETVLLGLARGSGLRSIAGMPRERGIFRRPLLDLPRAAVHAAVPEGAPLVDDPHNGDDRFARARVRHTVLPMLERELGPGIAAALARTADLARADADALGELADEAAWDLLHGARDEGTLDVDPLGGLHAAVLSRVLRTWLVEGGCPPGSLSSSHVQRVTRLVTAWKGQGAVALPGGVEAYRDCGRLCLRTTPQRLEP